MSGALGPLSFTVSDAETDARSLTVVAMSSNPTLIPASGLELEGSGAARALTIYAAEQGSGSADITLTVTDASGARMATTFKLQVNELLEAEFSDWLRKLALTRGPDADPVGIAAEEGGELPQIEDMNRIEVDDATRDKTDAYDDLLPPPEPTEGSV